ncbi:hypothetical protein GCM10010124_02470 [Pilimelia terevasa]|uniref:Uncharacterized protein n=1 Tax=Pilimelia terevasa TaxID=53372 RepID=A0A8J3BDG7_9ACTN|nr:sigma-70 family RNA polymerase sigma factor [Pilimelia terevasa]GGK13430.1 hypothetical protein GCM10010124_02470 [Pilimelia terevasa]
MTNYDRRLVERLLPTVWDPYAAYGITDSTAPDPDMPRARVDPAIRGTLYAHLADIKTGWQRAPLRPEERQAVLLYYGLDQDQRHIAHVQGVTRQTVGERVDRGVGRIVDCLNGTAA